MFEKSIIFHIAVNSAFLFWEATYRLYHKGGTLDIRTVPSAVGGDMSMRHGIVLVKSIPERKYRITTGGNHTGSKEEMSESFTGTTEL